MPTLNNVWAMYAVYALQIGSVYMEQGDLESALSTYMDALEHSPDNPELLTTVGITFLRCACAAPAA
jgi:Tfp pilus assembly protein PilF